MATQIKLRRDTAANWLLEDPVLGAGEPGFELVTGKLKIGDGVNLWSALDYIVAEPDGSIDLGAVDKNLLPATDNAYDLGSPSKRWRHVYAADGSVYIGDIKLSNSAGTLIVQQVTNAGEITEAPVATPGVVTTDRLVNGMHSFSINSSGALQLDGAPYIGSATGLPENTLGYLYNDGNGTLTWASGAGGGGAANLGNLTVTDSTITSSDAYVNVFGGDLNATFAGVAVGNNFAEFFAENDHEGSHQGWAWIKTDAVDHTAPTAFIDITPSNTGIARRWTFDSDGTLTLPTGGIISGLNIVGDEGSNVQAQTVDSASNVYIRTYDTLRQERYEWHFTAEGELQGGEGGSITFDNIRGLRGNDLTLYAGGPARNTRIVRFVSAANIFESTYLVNGLDYQVNDIPVNNGAIIWQALGSSTNIQSIVDNQDTTWTITFNDPVQLAPATDYTIEWNGNPNNSVRLETNNSNWEFEANGAIRFFNNSRQWTASSVLEESLPYALDINTNINRIATYGSPQAEIDPGVMTPVTLPGAQDDSFVAITDLPFAIYFLGQNYTTLGVGSNSYISFGGTTDNYNFGDDPTMDGAKLPAILISEADNSFQRVYTHTAGSTGSQEFTIRYEGTNSTGGIPGQPNIVWQVTFYEATPDVFTLLLIQDARGLGGISGITNGNYWQLMDGTGNRILPRLPWNHFAPNSIKFNNSSINIDNNNNATVSVGLDGSSLPIQTVQDGTNWNNSFIQPTLSLGRNTSDVTITDAESDVDHRGNRNILIQGERGFYANGEGGTGAGGKGTSINIIGGLGGESSEPNNGGEGGTVNIRGGTGQHGGPGGGWVNIYGGDAAEWNDAAGSPSGGRVYIKGGNAYNLPTGKGFGGDVFLQAGQGENGDGPVRVETYNREKGQWNGWTFSPEGSLQLPNGYSLLAAQNVWINAGSAPTVAYTSIDPYVGSIKATIKVYVRQADDINGDHDEDTQVCEMLIATKQRFIDNGGIWIKTAVGTVYGVTHTSDTPLATFTVNFVQGYVAGPGIPPKDVVQILAEPTAAVTGTNMWVMVAATEMTND